MEIKIADINDFDIAFDFIESLWDYNTYDKNEILNVYKEILEDKNSFAFFITDNGEYKGFCNGDFFNTFWMSGKTCYLSSLIVKEGERGKGYGRKLLDCVKTTAKNNGCKAVILDSGIRRVNAHRFYENYGFEKSCYAFEFIL